MFDGKAAVTSSRGGPDSRADGGGETRFGEAELPMLLNQATRSGRAWPAGPRGRGHCEIRQGLAEVEGDGTELELSHFIGDRRGVRRAVGRRRPRRRGEACRLPRGWARGSGPPSCIAWREKRRSSRRRSARYDRKPRREGDRRGPGRRQGAGAAARHQSARLWQREERERARRVPQISTAIHDGFDTVTGAKPTIAERSRRKAVRARCINRARGVGCAIRHGREADGRTENGCMFARLI